MLYGFFLTMSRCMYYYTVLLVLNVGRITVLYFDVHVCTVLQDYCSMQVGSLYCTAFCLNYLLFNIRWISAPTTHSILRHSFPGNWSRMFLCCRYDVTSSLLGLVLLLIADSLKNCNISNFRSPKKHMVKGPVSRDFLPQK